MTHRRSRVSTAAFLTVILSLVLCAGAWAQELDDPTSSEDRAVEGQATDNRGDVSAEQAGECHPSYEGACLDPNASDYDCEGGGGNGPRFVRGPIRVVGDDPFDLDTDDPDNIACEESASGGFDDAAGYDAGGYDSGTPSGGIASGYGPVAPAREAGPSPALLIGGAGLGVLALAGLGAGRLRRGG